MVINKGWNAFMMDCVNNRNILNQADFMEMMQMGPVFTKKFEDAGIVVVTTAFSNTPFESMCGARSMPKFMTDLYRIPDKVQAAMDAAMPDIIEGIKMQIKMANPLTVLLSGARSGSDIISPKLFERFFWPYKKKLVEAVVNEGVFVYLHMDSRWDKYLHYYKELPKGKCIFHSDGMTDIFKMKEVLGGHLCLMGDVHPSMLTLGTPDEVYNYTKRLLKEIGPDGFLLSAGCGVPADAKAENMEAMVAAALGK
jgi:uroporphyrinogen-III decarboxylase